MAALARCIGASMKLMMNMSPMSAMPIECGNDARRDITADITGVGVMIENADELDLGILGDLAFEVINQGIDGLASGFALADFGDIKRIFFLEHRLYHVDLREKPVY
jgi:hypothetical protein